MSVTAHPPVCACCRSDHPRLALRRELSASERHVDVHGLVAALDSAKLDLYAEIVREQRRAARDIARGRRASLVVTPRMAAILAGLYRRGVQAAHDEAASMGVTLRRGYEAEPAPPAPGTERGYVRLRLLLGALSRRLNGVAAVRREVTAGSQTEITRALIRIPGALDAAGRVVSKTMFSGLGDVFAANADVFAGWEHSAVLDGATCDECAEADGTTYATWADAIEDLPDGGPYIRCEGGDRCRCRLVPIAA